MIQTVFDDLGPFRATLQADGYDVRVDSLDDGRLHVTIVANEDTCEECLVPKPLMTHLLAKHLTRHEITEICLRYPGDG